MRQKVSTQLDEMVFRRARLEAMLQRRQISDIIQDALTRYLDEKGTPTSAGSVVDETWGIMKPIPEDVFREIMEEDIWDEGH